MPRKQLQPVRCICGVFYGSLLDQSSKQFNELRDICDDLIRQRDASKEE